MCAAHETSNATFYKLLENRPPVYFQATCRMYHAIFPCTARMNNKVAVSPATKVASFMVGLRHTVIYWLPSVMRQVSLKTYWWSTYVTLVSTEYLYLCWVEWLLRLHDRMFHCWVMNAHTNNFDKAEKQFFCCSNINVGGSLYSHQLSVLQTHKQLQKEVMLGCCC